MEQRSCTRGHSVALSENVLKKLGSIWGSGGAEFKSPRPDHLESITYDSEQSESFLLEQRGNNWGSENAMVQGHLAGVVPRASTIARTPPLQSQPHETSSPATEPPHTEVAHSRAGACVDS
jgi:hypothetical protein